MTYDRERPDDGAETCVLQALAELLDVDCGIAVAIANVIGFSLLGIIVIIAFAIIKRRLVFTDGDKYILLKFIKLIY